MGYNNMKTVASGGSTIQVGFPDTANTVTVLTGAASAVIDSTQDRVVNIQADGDTLIHISDSADGSSGYMRIAGGTTMDVGIRAGDKIASVGATIRITPYRTI